MAPHPTTPIASDPRADVAALDASVKAINSGIAVTLEPRRVCFVEDCWPQGDPMPPQGVVVIALNDESADIQLCRKHARLLLEGLGRVIGEA